MKQKLGYFCWDTRWRLEKDLEQVWKGNKKEPWEALKRSFRVYEFLGNKKDNNYTQLVTILLDGN